MHNNKNLKSKSIVCEYFKIKENCGGLNKWEVRGAWKEQLGEHIQCLLISWNQNLLGCDNMQCFLSKMTICFYKKQMVNWPSWFSQKMLGFFQFLSQQCNFCQSHCTYLLVAISMRKFQPLDLSFQLWREKKYKLHQPEVPIPLLRLKELYRNYKTPSACAWNMSNKPLMIFAFGSSLITALLTIVRALWAYLKTIKEKKRAKMHGLSVN